MGCLGGGSAPDPPPPPAPPPIPSVVDEGVRRKRESIRQRMLAAVGRGGTILTRGLFDEDENFQTLLGGGE
jgi:hypothetical protein